MYIMYYFIIIEPMKKHRRSSQPKMRFVNKKLFNIIMYSTL